MVSQTLPRVPGYFGADDQQGPRGGHEQMIKVISVSSMKAVGWGEGREGRTASVMVLREDFSEEAIFSLRSEGDKRSGF